MRRVKESMSGANRQETKPSVVEWNINDLQHLATVCWIKFVTIGSALLFSAFRLSI
ncbi:hypothetical protein E1A91_A12G041300v1 [Gossypium mustelinum]|uniref:Uncharacterized protein n=1 Tax=Gossypium mustelinum TaxID=34275 RepID=A0A5D2WPF4_GOSMU|nr:hypothetical protein E1A91_A12G041300v1 [Gossypium mustelinum]